MSLMMLGIAADPVWGPPKNDFWGPGIHIFAASWCGHCQAMKNDPQNKKFASAMKMRAPGDVSPHTLIQKFGEKCAVWCHELSSAEDRAEALKEKFVYNGFPSIIFKYKPGKTGAAQFKPYNGNRVISSDDDDNMVAAYMQMDPH
jgi:thiol-disulfide isomerase/thioredoxin